MYFELFDVFFGNMFNMYYKRIGDLRQDHDFSQREAARKIGFNREVYRRYETGEREISAACLIKIAQFYDVTLDYLTGLSDTKHPVEPYPDIIYDSKQVVVAERKTKL